MLDESASLYCRSSFRSEIITVTCRDSRAHSRDYTKKLVICSCHVSFYTYSRTRSPTLSITKTNIALVNLKKRSGFDIPQPIHSRTTELHTTKYTSIRGENAHMTTQIRSRGTFDFDFQTLRCPHDPDPHLALSFHSMVADTIGTRWFPHAG